MCDSCMTLTESSQNDFFLSNVSNNRLMFINSWFYVKKFISNAVITGVIPISLLLLATGTVLGKAAIDRGVRLATGRYGCQYRGVLT